MPPFDAQIRIAGPTEFSRVLAVYAAAGYRREINPADTVWLAERAGEAVGVVRVAAEHGVMVLRGMRIARHAQRQRLGTQMLYAIAQWLGDRECYCVPYRHLAGFYGQIGFVEREPEEVEPEAALPFLAERVAGYRRSGEDVVLMWRPPYFEAGARPSVNSM